MVSSPLFHCAVEVLEARIAPASLSFVDVDGDNVTITTNHGSDAQLQTAAHLSEVTAGHFQLQELELHDVAAFRVTNVTIEATANGGDGFVNVGYINATDADLGRVVVDGDLGRIDAGDHLLSTRGLNLLEVKSMGALNVSTQAVGGTLLSTIKGSTGALRVHGDILEAQLEISGSLERCDIEGSIIGGANEKSGSISTHDAFAHVTIAGLLQGGAGIDSGRIHSDSNLTDVTIAGGILGGGGDNSGQAAAHQQLQKITVNGNIIGGAGAESGALTTGRAALKVTVNGNIQGGTGTQSGELASAGSIGGITLNGSLLGGTGAQSGTFGTDKGMSDVHITGNVTGASGASSGQVVSKGFIRGFTLDGSLIGGANFETGALGSLKGVDDITIGGDIVAGTGERSGLLVCDAVANASIGSVKIAGSINGVPAAGVAGPNSGGILSGHVIVSVEIGADVLGGDTPDAGSIRARDGIKNVTVHGNLAGGAGFGSGVVSSATSIAAVSIDGSILGGGGGQSGAILSQQTLGVIKVGHDIVGGSGDESGEISVASPVKPSVAKSGASIERSATANSSNANIASVFVDGSIFGFNSRAEFGSFTGRIVSSGNIGTVSVVGDVNGGGQTGSGSILAQGNVKSVTIGGQLAGGGGSDTGFILARNNLGSVRINHDLVGGSGFNSGAIVSGGKISHVDIGGSIIGGVGGLSGRVETANFREGIGDSVGRFGPIGSVRVGGNVTGGNGDESGALQGGSIALVVIDGSVVGGNGADSGAITAADADLVDVTIHGDLTGGLGARAGHVGAARNIGSLEIGAIRGLISDGVAFPSLITAGGTLSPANNAHALALQKLVIDEATTTAEILVGYDLFKAPVNPDAQIGSVVVGVGDGNGIWGGTNLVAGATSGADQQFGTSDDAPIVAAGDVQAIISRIGRIIIKGQIIPAEVQSAMTYGIVAEEIVALKLNGAAVSLTAGPSNDFIPIGSTGDTTLVETGARVT